MKKSPQPLRRPASFQRGFALIATLSMMILLTLIAVGLLSLSTVTIRSGKAEADLAIARANARLAMMQALSELQHLAGPDQRVTATARILEQPDASGNITTTAQNPHWTGVWRTDRYKGETSANPIIKRDTNLTGAGTGSLTDRRADGSYRKDQQVLDWLVSRPDPSTPVDPTSPLTADNGLTNITLVDTGSLGTTAPATDKVTVPVVPIQQGGQRTGGYAWWVGDEGVKARLDLAPGTNSQPELRAASANQFGISAMNGLANFDQVPKTERPRIISRGSGELAGNAAVPQSAMRAAFHSLTSHSAGVLADTLNGGLKRDLTAFLATGTLAAYGPNRPAVTTTTPLIDTPNLRAISAQMGLLKSWNDLDNTMNSNREIAIVPPVKASAMSTFLDATLGANTTKFYSTPSITNYNTSPTHPVIVDASISYGLSLKPAPSVSPNHYEICLHIYPHFALWNPYNARLSTSGYAVQSGVNPTLFCRIAHRDTNATQTLWKNTNGVLSGDGSSDYNIFDKTTLSWLQAGTTPTNLLAAPVFWIPPTSFEPGEALLFTADSPSSAANSTTLWTPNGNLNNFALSCSVVGSSLEKNSFVIETRRYLNIPNDPSNFENGNPKFHYAFKYGDANAMKRGVFSNLWQANNSGITPLAALNHAQTFPLQSITQSEDGKYLGDLPKCDYPPGSFPRVHLDLITDLTNREPFPRQKWGQRIQWFQDTTANRSPQNNAGGSVLAPFLEHNMLTSNNLRSDWHIRSPADFAYRIHGASGTSYGRYAHGILIDDMLEWDWKNYRPTPSSGGKNRVSPFGRPTDFGDTTYPLFDLPQRDVPLMSLAALQHVPLSNFYWHPSYAIGNALADMRVARNRTTDHVVRSNWDQMGYHGSPWEQRWQQSRQNLLETPGQPEQTFLYDLSYEANHALWDRYFLSSIPRNHTATSPVPNPRMSPLGTDSSTVSRLLDGNQAASRLMLNGAFNVNSTSEDAWAAWLGSMRDNPAMQVFFDNGSTQANNVFSRLLRPHNQRISGGDPYSQATWSGFRELSDGDIRNLAKEIVLEVKRRGPFISLADFVNRRLVDPPRTSGSETELSRTGLKGALQAAIDRTSINQLLANTFKIEKLEYDESTSLHAQAQYGTTYPDLRWNGMGIKPDHNHYADSKLTGSPGWLTQADLLQKLGATISARSDTFVIRTYGESRNPTTGAVLATAWAECVVQRTPEPITPDSNSNNLDSNFTSPADLGRRFQSVSFRWLNSNEI